MSLAGILIILLGMGVLVIAALGVLRLADALARQHAATKAATIGVLLFAIGLALVAWGEGWGAGWIVRLLLLFCLLLVTLPLASHAVARAGLAESNQDTEHRQGDRQG